MEGEPIRYLQYSLLEKKKKCKLVVFHFAPNLNTKDSPGGYSWEFLVGVFRPVLQMAYIREYPPPRNTLMRSPLSCTSSTYSQYVPLSN